MARRKIDSSLKDEYLDWLLTPPGEREIEKKQDMAEHLGVHPSTLYNWENSPEFQNELRQLKSRWGAKFHGDILSRLITIVREGTDTAAIQAAKVLLPHLDTGPREINEDDLTEEHVLAIKKALSEQGFEVTG